MADKKTNDIGMKIVRIPNSKGGFFNDVVILYGMYELDLGRVFRTLSETEKQPVNQPLQFSERGDDQIMVTGDHYALHYRGNALKRHKIWCQTGYGNGLLKYGYTGWQNAVAYATRDVRAFPPLETLLIWLNRAFPGILKRCGLPEQKALFNHVIFTRYEDGNDFIGMHSDKEKDFVEGSYFVVIKLGAARDFAFSTREGKSVFQKELPMGSMVIVRTGTANTELKHGVPRLQKGETCGPSGSIVFRCIKTRVPWGKVERDVAKAARAKTARESRKRARAD
jgi:DNA oxidative demethylase